MKHYKVVGRPPGISYDETLRAIGSKRGVFAHRVLDPRAVARMYLTSLRLNVLHQGQCSTDKCQRLSGSFVYCFICVCSS